MSEAFIASAPDTEAELDRLRAEVARLTEERDAALLQARFDRALLEVSPSILWTARSDGTLIYLSRHYYEHTGFDPEEVPPADWVKGLHPDDAESVYAAWDHARANGVLYDIEFRLATPTDYRWIRARAAPLRDEAGRIIAWLGNNSDIHDSRTQAENLQRLAIIVEQSQDFIGYADLQGNVQYVNEAGRALMGMTGDPREGEVANYFVPEDRARIPAEIFPAATENGHWSGELRFQNFFTSEAIPVRYNIFTLHDGGGRPIGYGTVTPDLREAKKNEVQREALTRELAHRMKNTLSVVQAIATQTLRSSQDLSEARMAISARLNALARAQDILTATGWSHARVDEVVRAALAPHCANDARVSFAGPTVELSARRTLGLSLAIHELATNAVKYGALSGETGQVTLRWSVREDSFAFEWIESEGPAVHAPSSRGFGSKLLERIVAAYFDGKADILFEPAGVRFALEGKFGPE